MFEFIKKLLCNSKEKKKIAFNDSFCLYNDKGMHTVTDFTGHLSFDEKTECDVEHATFDVVIENTRYLDGTMEYHAPWSRGVNRIYWHDGTVTGGDLHCHSFENGCFNGNRLIVNEKMNGTFNGKELHEGVNF